MRPIHFAICLMAISCTCLVSAQEAYVYDTVAAGTYVYDASSTGKLTPIKGSPFQTTGQLIGTNGKFFLTQGSGYVFVYAVESNGGIGKLESKTNTLIYSGSDCSSAPSGALDHSGSYIYMLFDGGSSGDGGTCAAVQTYEMSSKGELTFKGATSAGVGTELPKVTGNNKFGYSVEFSGDASEDNAVQGFTRESSGTLNQNFSVNPPTPKPQSGYYYVWAGPITPDPTDHLAVVVNQCEDGCSYDMLPDQLASFTVVSQGEVVSTNTYADMPTFTDADSISSMVLDPTGKILAVAIDTGVEFFHFNGAAPITPFKGVGMIGLTGYVTGMAWDSDGHLYAQNAATGRMHVYEVTKTSAKELPGSPTLIPIGNSHGYPVSSFVVRPK